MSAVVVTLVASLGVWAAWRGFRRGAFSTFLGWLPTLGGVLILLIAIRAAWSQPEHFGSVCALGGIAAAALFIAGTLAVRRWESYAKLKSELAHLAARQDDKAKLDEKKQKRELSREIKRMKENPQRKKDINR